MGVLLFTNCGVLWSKKKLWGSFYEKFIAVPIKNTYSPGIFISAQSLLALLWRLYKWSAYETHIYVYIICPNRHQVSCLLVLQILSYMPFKKKKKKHMDKTGKLL